MVFVVNKTEYRKKWIQSILKDLIKHKITKGEALILLLEIKNP